MRLFIAIPLPDELTAALAESQPHSDAIRWQQMSQMHITLKFLGDAGESGIAELKAALAEKVQVQPFGLNVIGWGTFPQHGAPKIVWAGLSEKGELTALQQQVEEVCSVLGFEEKSRAFIPHITLGRVKGHCTRKELGLLMENVSGPGKEFMVRTYALYESKTKPGGAEYHIVKEYPLPEQRPGNG